MIGILGGMGTQAGLDFCNKLAILYRGKIDQEYPLFLLFNKSNIPGRPESIGVQTKNLSNRKKNKKIEKKYSLVLKSLLNGCNILKKSKCKFIVIPCNTAHYWYDDLQKKINLPIKQIDKNENFRRIIDVKNNSGWIHVSQLKQINSIIPLKDKILFQTPSNFSKPLAKIKKGRILIVKRCNEDWCQIKTSKFKGWIKNTNLWGEIK